MSIWNERVKLLASGLNSLAVAMVALGILAPLAKTLFVGGSETNAVLLVWWGLAAVAVHLTAKWILGELVEE